MRPANLLPKVTTSAGLMDGADSLHNNITPLFKSRAEKWQMFICLSYSVDSTNSLVLSIIKHNDVYYYYYY